MLTPMQINSQRFSQNGKGGYKASEVDAFFQKVSKSYSKLYNDNNILNERLASISPVIDEYNRNKAAIANALLSAQTAADSKLEEANMTADAAIRSAEEKAEALFNEKSAEAEAYYVQKTHEADEKLASLQREYTKLKSESDAYREKYLADVRAKVDEIISGANEKASVIVAKAYEDARVARERADRIIDEANAELLKIKEETTKIKKELSSLIELAQVVVSESEEYEPIEKKEAASEPTKEETVIPVEIPEFDLKSALEEDTEIPEAEEEDVTIYEKKDFQVNPSEDNDELFSHSAEEKGNQQAEIPDVNSYLAKIFDSTEDNDFGFGDLISESGDSDK
ncbi:MAG: DivIVA domain-containing protein [Clostridia bacterium]|nr:DivIVA domain-containing protein [Clostridia bacterium]